MALIFADGFDHYGSGSAGSTKILEHPSYVYSYGTPEVTNPRTGSYSYKCVMPGSVGWSLGRYIVNSSTHYTSIGFGGSFNIPTVSTDYVALFMLGENTYFQIGCQVNATDGSISIVRREKSSSGGTILGTTAGGIFTNGAWVSVRMFVVGSSTISATDGTITLKATTASGATTTLTLTNVNTYNAAQTSNAFYTSITIGGCNSSNVMYVDDIFCNDSTGSVNNSIMDDMRCYITTLTADTATADWTPASGSGFSNLNAVPSTPSTKYVQASASGNVSRYINGTVSSALSTIAGIVRFTEASATSTGSFTVTQYGSGGGAATGSAHTLTTSSAYYTDVYETDPGTSAAWAASAITGSSVALTRTA